MDGGVASYSLARGSDAGVGCDHKAAVARLDGPSFRWLFPHSLIAAVSFIALLFTGPLPLPYGPRGVTGGKPAVQGRQEYPTTRGLASQAQADTVLTAEVDSSGLGAAPARPLRERATVHLGDPIQTCLASGPTRSTTCGGVSGAPVSASSISRRL